MKDGNITPQILFQSSQLATVCLCRLQADKNDVYLFQGDFDCISHIFHAKVDYSSGQSCHLVSVRHRQVPGTGEGHKKVCFYWEMTSRIQRKRREVIAVGQRKPISCGEPTFVQSSVVDNKEFVFPVVLRPSVRRATRSQVLYRQHHLHNRIHDHWYLGIHFFHCRPVFMWSLR